MCIRDSSKYKRGIRDLREGYREAEYALRYHMAREMHGIVWYKNIETLFSQSAPEVPDIVKDLTGRLMNPEERSGVAEQMEQALENICLQPVSYTHLRSGDNYPKGAGIPAAQRHPTGLRQVSGRSRQDRIHSRWNRCV